MTRAILYDASGHDQETDLSKLDPLNLGPEQLLWVDFSGTDASDLAQLPPELQGSVGKVADLGPLEINEDSYRFAITVHERERSYLGFVVGKSWLLTFSEGRPDYFDDFLKSDRGETLKGRLTATGLMAALLLRHYNAFRTEVTHVDTSIDKLDETILRSREKRAPLGTLAALRRRVAGLRSALSEQRPIVQRLIGPDFLAHVGSGDHAYLFEINRSFERLEDDIARARETVIGSFELYASRVAQDTNQLVKALTIATVITGVIGALAGIFGMNFDTSIPHTGMEGFVLVTGAMFLVSILMVVIAIKKNWL